MKLSSNSCTKTKNERAVVFALLTIRVDRTWIPHICGDRCRRQRGDQSPDILRVRNWTDGSCPRLLQGPVPRRPPLFYAALKLVSLGSLVSPQESAKHLDYSLPRSCSMPALSRLSNFPVLLEIPSANECRSQKAVTYSILYGPIRYKAL